MGKARRASVAQRRGSVLNVAAPKLAKVKAELICMAHQYLLVSSPYFTSCFLSLTLFLISILIYVSLYF